MWLKALIAIILFYFSVILQNSFFVHFVYYGASLNLVFVFFFLFIFFEKPRAYLSVIFYAASAGFFLDIFSNAVFGTSMISLIVMGILVKKVQSLLKEERENHPFVYFMPLFFISFMVYSLLLQASLFIFVLPGAMPNLSLRFVAEIIYNLIFACLVFYIYKKYIRSNINNQKVRFFSK